ncbi:ParB/Srx family N-terminal domain-containing protein [Cohaesibacter haloalkalitolerans]|uniref:ParB/Srx family N-terminal domain-containing protein n=1 Tax=Cohaesibacter haloalkalitolerans TaxID=1162980 RepID=UPI000E65B7CB|nr:ParB/Srx family N-terminal domain-containing protein [Cohaesibacter haloalkalitolerans]
MIERDQAIKQLLSEAGVNPPENSEPQNLPLDAIKTEYEIFQPRAECSGHHIRTLKSAISARDGKPLNPLTVWYSGKNWYVIDGHHRLEAYKLFNEDNPQRPLLSVPVKAFHGSLSQAICHSAEANSRDKLPMRQTDKSNIAWRLVCLDDNSLKAARIAEAASVSRRTIQTMRKAFRKLVEMTDKEDLQNYSKSELINLSWFEADRLARGEQSSDWQPDAFEQQGIEWAERFRHEFGPKLDSNPEATAFALLHYCESLPKRLIESEAFEDALEDLLLERRLEDAREQGIPESEVFY